MTNDYQKNAETISKLFLEHGADYLSNIDTDTLLRDNLYAFFDRMPQDKLQAEIDSINERLDSALLKKGITALQVKNTRTAFYDMTKQYAVQNNLFLRVSSPTFAKTESMRLMAYLHEDARQQASFRTVFLESAHHSNPDNFQATIQELEKQLTPEQKNQMDSLITEHNARSRNKFETERISLTEEEKANSWQGKNANTFLSKKIRDFQERLEAIKKDRLRPQDKYDRGIVNTALRTLINLQSIITEVANFITENMKYYESDKQNRKADKEANKNAHTAFYDVMKDAYETKGVELGALLNSGQIDAKMAETIFITDIAYIKSLRTEEQPELFSAYVKSMQEALQMQGLTYECKNSLMTMMANYENGNYDNQIQEKIKNKEFYWDKVNPDIKEKQNQDIKYTQKENQEKEETNNEANKQQEQATVKKGSPQEKMLLDGTYAAEACKIGTDIAMQKDLQTADEKTIAFLQQISQFAKKHASLDTDKINHYTALAAAALLTSDKNKELEQNMRQFNTKYFFANSEQSRITILLDATAKVDMAGVKETNPVRTLLHHAVEQALENREPEKQQEFLSTIAERVKMEKQQYYLTMEAKSFHLSARAPKALSTQEKQKRSMDLLLEKYTRKAANPHIDTFQSFTALCDRMPGKGNEKLVYDTILAGLEGNKAAIATLNHDAKQFNELNQQYGFPEIDFAVGKQQEHSNSIEIDVSQPEQPAKTEKKSRAEMLRDSFRQIDAVHIPNPEEPMTNQKGQKKEITNQQLLEAFNTGRNQDQLFEQFIAGKSTQEIQETVTMLDNQVTQEGGYRLADALDSCGLYEIKAPYSEKLMDKMYQDMEEYREF